MVARQHAGIGLFERQQEQRGQLGNQGKLGGQHAPNLGGLYRVYMLAAASAALGCFKAAWAGMGGCWEHQHVFNKPRACGCWLGSGG